MIRYKRQNIERIKIAAHQLGNLTNEMVFAGGAATGLLITDPAAPDVRPTADIDVIVEIITRFEYYRFQELLVQRGFRQSIEDEVICRWRYQNIILDVMPTDERILGFSNRWYSDAFRNAESKDIEGMEIKVIKSAYFLGTKLEAFYGRGKGDYMVSCDMEDIVAVLNGRPEIVEDVRNSDVEIKIYLKNHFERLLKKNEFLDSISGHLLPDKASQDRVCIIEDRIRQIIEMT